jgi:hypothetical protein
MFELHEVPLERSAGPLAKPVWEFVEEGLRRGKQIDCFDYVPSNYDVVYAALSTLPRGRFCEWGSGMGIITGLAEMLGFNAHGIELDPRLVAASRRLLADFGLSASIGTGDYLDVQHAADITFVYCWPGQVSRAEEHFLATAADGARLLVYFGPEDFRCEVKRRPES